MPTIPSAIDTSTPAANRTNISPISTPPRADSLTRRSGVSRVARWSHLVAGGSSAEGRPHLPDQRGEHREGHEGQASGNEEHRRPKWIQHDRRDAAVAIGRERGLRGHPDDDGEEGHRGGGGGAPPVSVGGGFEGALAGGARALAPDARGARADPACLLDPLPGRIAAAHPELGQALARRLVRRVGVLPLLLLEV